MTDGDRLDEIERLERHMRKGNSRYEAYYYGFEPTGEAAVDRVLAALARAGKAYHHTEDWDEPLEEGISVVELIQRAANVAASELRDARADRDQSRKAQMLLAEVANEEAVKSSYTIDKLRAELTAERAKVQRVEALCDDADAILRYALPPSMAESAFSEVRTDQVRRALAGGKQ